MRARERVQGWLRAGWQGVAIGIGKPQGKRRLELLWGAAAAAFEVAAQRGAPRIVSTLITLATGLLTLAMIRHVQRSGDQHEDRTEILLVAFGASLFCANAAQRLGDTIGVTFALCWATTTFVLGYAGARPEGWARCERALPWLLVSGLMAVCVGSAGLIATLIVKQTYNEAAVIYPVSSGAILALAIGVLHVRARRPQLTRAQSAVTRLGAWGVAAGACCAFAWVYREAVGCHTWPDAGSEPLSHGARALIAGALTALIGLLVADATAVAQPRARLGAWVLAGVAFGAVVALAHWRVSGTVELGHFWVEPLSWASIGLGVYVGDRWCARYGWYDGPVPIARAEDAPNTAGTAA